MRIIQMLPTISFGDAVGNDTRAIDNILKEMGYETQIYAENIDQRLPKDTAYHIDQIGELKADDVIIYHASTGTDLNYKLASYLCRKVMIYHNITPPEFFSPYSLAAENLTKSGLAGMRYLADKVDYCIADSDFNKQDLLRMGYTCPIDVCPILIPFSDYDAPPSKTVLSRYQNDGITNLLFVGRIAPNKKQEDVIAAFYYYHKYYNPKSRLFLVGSWNGMESYYKQLCAYIQELGLENHVIFPGHIKFDEILAYYSLADVFLCMSEHEGFCVPLVEAMYFEIPIVAYRCAAIPFTMGGQGLLLDSKEPAFAAAVIDRVVTSRTLQNHVVELQNQRLQDYGYATVRSRFEEILQTVLRKKDHRKPRIVQLSSTISRGDAVSNDILAFQNAFVKMEYPAPVYTEIAPKGYGWESVQNISELCGLSADDVVLYHHATGTALAEQFAGLPCKKVLVYHNVTPSAFFAPFDKAAESSCQRGLDNLKSMQPYMDRCVADSDFNKRDLLRMGYTCPIDVCPILIPFSDYNQEADRELLESLLDGKENIIFVGRVAPNKKLEDVIACFSEYKKSHSSARLFLVGSCDKRGAYYKFLEQFIRQLQVEDVYFSGHISFSEILAYYRAADLFLCMSEHEGFCVPLLEAMYFDVPVVAFSSTAIPETLGGAGVLVEEKTPAVVATIMEKVLKDKAYRSRVVQGQRERLRAFSYGSVNEILENIICRITRDKHER